MSAGWKKHLRSPWLQLSCILLVYAMILLPTVERQGISWDEQTDIWVARAYLKGADGWWAGSDIDPSQTRLPTFSVALFYKLLNQSGLILGRYVSTAVGALTLVAVYITFKRRGQPMRGFLAGTLLATSPFFLSFARVAFTETDIYLACALAWLLVGVDQFQKQPSIRWAAVVGVVMGLAISAKFTALVIFPALWYAAWQSKHGEAGSSLPREKSRSLIFWLVLQLGGIVGGVYVAHTLPPETSLGSLRFFHYLIILSIWSISLAWALWRSKHTASWLMFSIFITSLAVITFLVFPPEHLTNPTLLESLTSRMENEMGFNPGFMLEASALHILCIFFKSSLLIGAGLLLSLIGVTRQWHKREYSFPILATWLYLGCLVVLPLAQTFYTIPVLPFLAIFTADRFLSLAARWRKVALGLAGLAIILLYADFAQCYPDFNLNGYQWLGERVLVGRASVGYRSVVQTPSDGVQQAIEYINSHARPGDRVRAYVMPWHIVEATAPHPAYRLENAFQGNLSSNPDYVVVEINIQIRQSWWIDSPPEDVFTPIYDAAWLEKYYTRVFTVRRAFGIEMASVYRKK